MGILIRIAFFVASTALALFIISYLNPQPGWLCFIVGIVCGSFGQQWAKVAIDVFRTLKGQ